MKMWKKWLASVITGVLLFSLSVCNVFAASMEENVPKQAYTYKVTIYAGNQGAFSGTDGLVISNPNAVVTVDKDKIVISGLHYGDEVSYTAQTDVKLDASSKYYVKGIRLSGRDNDTVAAAAFLVRGDVDYVVAYGIKGNLVSYTVNYQNENGTELLPSETFYGNVGDKPVVACKYVAGYAPKTSGLTKTLKENASENVLTFIYKTSKEYVVEDVVDTIVNEERVDVFVNQTVVVGGGTGTGPGTGTGTGTGETGGTGTEEENQTGTDDVENPAEDTTGEEGITQEPEDVIIEDLDEVDVPLAEGIDLPNEVIQDQTLMKYGIVAGSAIIILLILLVSAVVMRRSAKKENKK